MSYNTDKQYSEFVDSEIETILRQKFTDVARIERASESDDMQGTDYWVVQNSGVRHSVDVKSRRKDFARLGEDDICLEIWSVLNKKVGWTLDSKKQTDFILYFWTDSKRHCMFSFPELNKVFTDNLTEWRKYKPCNPKTESESGSVYYSECCFVPRQIVWQALLSMNAGKPKE